MTKSCITRKKHFSQLTFYQNDDNVLEFICSFNEGLLKTVTDTSKSFWMQILTHAEIKIFPKGLWSSYNMFQHYFYCLQETIFCKCKHTFKFMQLSNFLSSLFNSDIINIIFELTKCLYKLFWKSYILGVLL